MDIVFGVIIGLLAITILVAIHELGHAIIARRNGVVLEEFGIGFPPRAWAKRAKSSFLGKNVLYSINWLPLGGFVKLQGEHDMDTKPGDYGAVGLWAKTKILLAGVFVNWLAAAVLLTILALVGMPKILPNQFTIPGDIQVSKKPVELAVVVDGAPAQAAGLKRGDQIIRFDGRPLQNVDDLKNFAVERKGRTVEVAYVRGGVDRTVKVTLREKNDDGKGYFGANPAQQETLRSTWSAPIVGVGMTVQLTGATLQGLGDMIAKGVSGLVLQFSSDAKTRDLARKDLGAVGDGVAGPVGIFGVIFPAATKAGLVSVLMLTGVISLTLAIMNILPIPALDGGRWAVTVLFRLLKKPLNAELEEKIHGIGFLVLMGLVVLVTIADIRKF